MSSAGYQLERFGLVIVWLAVIALFGAMRPDTFLTWSNFFEHLRVGSGSGDRDARPHHSADGGDFDLSIAQTLTFVSMLTAILSARMGLPIGYIIPIALLAGASSGSSTARSRSTSGPLPDRHVARRTFLHGITLWMSDSQTISGVSRVLMQYVIIQRVFGIPVSFYYAIVLAALVWYALSYTAFGQQLLFTGRGREVGRLTGVAVGRVRMAAFVCSGMMGAIAGILYTGTTGSANPTSGTTLLLPLSPPPSLAPPASSPDGSTPGDR